MRNTGIMCGRILQLSVPNVERLSVCRDLTRFQAVAECFYEGQKHQH